MWQPSTYCGLATPNYMNICQQISLSVVYNMEIHVSSSEWNYSPKQRKPGDHDICIRDLEFEKKNFFWVLMIFVVVAIETLNQNKNIASFKQWWYSTMQTTISDTTDAQMAYTQCKHTCDNILSNNYYLRDLTVRHFLIHALVVVTPVRCSRYWRQSPWTLSSSRAFYHRHQVGLRYGIPEKHDIAMFFAILMLGHQWGFP